jgi:hypothetical protein
MTRLQVWLHDPVGICWTANLHCRSVKLKNFGQDFIFYVLPFDPWCREVDFSVDAEWHLTSHDSRCM